MSCASCLLIAAVTLEPRVRLSEVRGGEMASEELAGASTKRLRFIDALLVFVAMWEDLSGLAMICVKVHKVITHVQHKALVRMCLCLSGILIAA